MYEDIMEKSSSDGTNEFGNRREARHKLKKIIDPYEG